VTKGRRFWPAAVSTGDLAQSGKAEHACPGEPWWHAPAAYLMLGTAFAIACTPFCILVWALWDGGWP
jgi:hypothetical protein